MSGLPVADLSAILFVPGNRPDRFDKAAQSGAPGIVIDLEDAVPQDAKDAARPQVLQWFAMRGDSDAIKAGIRVNSIYSRHGLNDMARLLDSGVSPDFLVLPKVESAFEALAAGKTGGDELIAYPVKLKASWIWKDLDKVRNVKPALKWGTLLGTLYGGFDMWCHDLGIRLPWTFHHHQADYETLRPASEFQPIAYPKPDGVLSFDKPSSVFLSSTNHEEDQPVHLRLRDPSIPIAVNLPLYAEPAQRYCPAGVYEVVTGDNGQQRFQINAQNCVHCKTCDIKDPAQNIDWSVPEGGGGPNYPNM